MGSGDKDGLSTDAVHIDASARLQVIQVNVAIFGDKENHILLGAYLLKTKINTVWVGKTTHGNLYCFFLLSNSK